MNNPQFPTARKTGLVVQEVPDEVLVYDLDTNKAHCLNKTAATIWKACDGKTSVSEIARIVEAEAGGKATDDLVWLALDQLSESNLLETEIRNGFAGHTRRDVIKKIGLASVIALPIVASLVAPQNALAVASCICMDNGDCGNTPCPSGICSSPGGTCIPAPSPTPTP